jgi:gluconolactonase
VVVRSDGSIYFTDLYGGLRGDRSLAARGLPYGLYRLMNGKLERLLREPSFGPSGNSPGVGPNGLAFSPDERLLYVAAAQYVLRYDVHADGTLVSAGVLFDMGAGGVDGIKVDTAGNVYISGPRGLWIVSPEGKRLGLISGPEQPHNFAWGGEDGRTLYLCAHTSIYRVRLNVVGARP